jgi:hypothetical protein
MECNRGHTSQHVTAHLEPADVIIRGASAEDAAGLEHGDIRAKLATISFIPVGNEADLMWWRAPHETPQRLLSGVTALIQYAS